MLKRINTECRVENISLLKGSLERTKVQDEVSQEKFEAILKHLRQKPFRLNKRQKDNI